MNPRGTLFSAETKQENNEAWLVNYKNTFTPTALNFLSIYLKKYEKDFGKKSLPATGIRSWLNPSWTGFVPKNLEFLGRTNQEPVQIALEAVENAFTEISKSLHDEKHIIQQTIIVLEKLIEAYKLAWRGDTTKQFDKAFKEFLGINTETYPVNKEKFQLEFLKRKRQLYKTVGIAIEDKQQEPKSPKKS